MADVTIYIVPAERKLWGKPGGIVRLDLPCPKEPKKEGK